MAEIERVAAETLTVVELDAGDALVFVDRAGVRHRIVLEQTCACRLEEMYDPSGIRPVAARGAYRFWCRLSIDGHSFSMNRYVGTPDSFYTPWEFNGLRLWLDAVAEVFEIVQETHGLCGMRKRARLAVQDAGLRICPVLLHPWCPLPPGGLRLQDCYRGEDCWLGPYDGRDAHGGLDINHPAGTPLWTPLAIDEHEMFNRQERDGNNRWRGLHHWEDGSTWVLETCHIIRLRIPEDRPIPAGYHYADSAGVATCYYDHTHFNFAIRQHGEEYRLDPWILFWQMYRDRRQTMVETR